MTNRRAVFLFPSDRMGGSERITRMLAREAALSCEFDVVDCLVLCWNRTGTLDDLEKLGNVSLHYTEKTTSYGIIVPCFRFLTRHRYDLVFSSHSHLNALCSLLRRLHLLHTQRLVTRESTLFFERNFGTIAHVLRVLYHAYGSQDLIICQTERMCQSFNAHTCNRYIKKCAVLPNPVEIARVAIAAEIAPPASVQDIPSNRIKIVWCGRLIPIKAPIRAVETLRALHDCEQTNIHLVMIGDGPLAADVKAAIAQLQLTDTVTLVGFDPNPISIMARCDIGFVTSDLEGFPNVILEMLAAGLQAVVTTDCAGELDEIPSVSVAETKEPQVLATTISRALGYPHTVATDEFLASRSPLAFFRTMRQS